MELQPLSVPGKESFQVQEGCLYILSDVLGMSLQTVTPSGHLSCAETTLDQSVMVPSISLHSW